MSANTPPQPPAPSEPTAAQEHRNVAVRNVVIAAVLAAAVLVLWFVVGRDDDKSADPAARPESCPDSGGGPVLVDALEPVPDSPVRGLSVSGTASILDGADAAYLCLEGFSIAPAADARLLLEYGESGNTAGARGAWQGTLSADDVSRYDAFVVDLEPRSAYEEFRLRVVVDDEEVATAGVSPPPPSDPELDAEATDQAPEDLRYPVSTDTAAVVNDLVANRIAYVNTGNRVFYQHFTVDPDAPVHSEFHDFVAEYQQQKQNVDIRAELVADVDEASIVGPVPLQEGVPNEVTFDVTLSYTSGFDCSEVTQVLRYHATIARAQDPALAQVNPDGSTQPVWIVTALSSDELAREEGEPCGPTVSTP